MPSPPLLCGTTLAGCHITVGQKIVDQLSYDRVDVSHLIERSLALGFKTAAESRKGLLLHSYEHHAGTDSVRHILAQLPAQHLQVLHLSFSDDGEEKDHDKRLPAVVPALAALTALTSLTLSRWVLKQYVVPSWQESVCNQWHNMDPAQPQQTGLQLQP